MAKKKSTKKAATNKKSEEKKKGPRKGTRIQTLREFYTKNPKATNQEALDHLLQKHPESNASIKSIVTWKYMLREEGMDIPRFRAGAKAKDESEKKSSTKSKSKSKKERKKKSA